MAKLPSAKDLQMKIAEIEGAKASAAARLHAAAEKEKEALLEKLRSPSGLSDDEVVEKAAVIVARAVEDGRTSVQVMRFPNHLCTDSGRAINQAEAGWEATLTGRPKELHAFWERRLKPLGYHLRYEIVDYPGGMPGDVGVTLSWS
jgi:hypothetical protein